MRLISFSSLLKRFNFRRRGVPGRIFARRRAAHLRLGRRGERLAERVLSELGLEILCRNFRCRHGEIDLVARADTLLCFIEVKTRRLSRWSGRPADAVTPAKRQRLLRTAQDYLHQLGQPELAYQFDIVEVVYSGRQLVEVRHLPNAFQH